jgi:hypothetical protein
MPGRSTLLHVWLVMFTAASVVTAILFARVVIALARSPAFRPAPAATPTRAPPTLTPLPSPFPTAPPPSLHDFWEGRADWQLEIVDVGLPVGESDTLVGPDGQVWSYLHASFQSAGVYDHFDQPVAFPGCVTLWTSADGGRRFQLTAPRCLLPCLAQPCQPIGDQIDQQQYPRVMRSGDGVYYMVYEWGGRTYLRSSYDGLTWSWSEHVRGTGIWTDVEGPCEPYQRIHPFPLLPDAYACLSGAPPGLFVEGDRLYVFVAMGKSPAHMGCLYGARAQGAAAMHVCHFNPLFMGAEVYGPTDTTGPETNPYFDFHIISSADVLNVGERYYMVYEGIRGVDQFALGLARTAGHDVDGPWEKYPGNPILGDLPGNVGLGHADLIVLDGVTYLYTATSAATRGRYVLAWSP